MRNLFFVLLLTLSWGFNWSEAQASKSFQNTLNAATAKAKDWVNTQLEAGKEHNEFSSNSNQSTAMQDALSNKADSIAKQLNADLGMLTKHIAALADMGELDTVQKALDANLNKDPCNVVCGSAPSIIETLSIGIAAYGKDKKVAGKLFKAIEKSDKLVAQYEKELEKWIRKIDGADSKPSMRDAMQRMLTNARVTAYERLITDSFAALGGAGVAEVCTLFQKKGLKHKSWRIRLGTIKALSKNPNISDASEFLQVIKKDKDSRVVSLAASAIGWMGKRTDQVKDALKQAINHKNTLVVASAADAAAQLKLYSLIPEIIKVMKREEGKIDEDLERALTRMTGETHHENHIVWENRWKNVLAKKFVDGQNSGVKVAQTTEKKEAGGGGSFSYYGITTSSKKMIFIIDISGSMRKPAAEDEKIVGSGSVVVKEEKVQGTSKIDVAKKHLVRAIKALDSKTVFNVIVYSNSFHRWNKVMQPATPANKNDVIDYINKQEAKGATNIFDPLEAAIQTAGRGAFDKHYKIACDTIFLLSDGSPNRGRIPNKDDILKEIAKLNELGRITIHTIGIGPSHSSGFMRKLANRNNGQYEGRGTKVPKR